MVEWRHIEQLKPLGYVCAYCGHRVGPNRGFFDSSGRHQILICSYCEKPTYFENGSEQTPGAPFGAEVAALPRDVEAMYKEARGSYAASAPTCAVLASRKILMHVAVEKGAKEGKTFIEYVEFLADKGYVPPDGKEWVDHIRKQGNEANHKIKLMSAPEAAELISFVELLLKFAYEMPSRIKPPATPANP